MDHDNSERPLLKWKDSSGKGKDIADDQSAESARDPLKTNSILLLRTFAGMPQPDTNILDLNPKGLYAA